MNFISLPLPVGLRLSSHFHLHPLNPLSSYSFSRAFVESHSTPGNMLKRQRPSSPISFPEEDTVAADLYEPDSKRRRYFAPYASTSQTKRDSTYLSDNDSEDGEGRESKRREVFSGKREWHAAAGVYKDANTLLHDLHAEQRHRTLFASPQQHASSSVNMLQAAYLSPYTHSRAASQSVKGYVNLPADSSIGLPHRPLSGFQLPLGGARMNYDGEGQNEEAEAEVVTQRYESSNRWVTSAISVLLLRDSSGLFLGYFVLYS